MSYNMKNVLGILFANSHDEAIPELTSNRATASVPFGGRFRLIDFQLSSMVNSGMTSVAVITKENYQSLLDHVGSGRYWDLARSDGGLILLPPYVNGNSGRYNGKLDALYGSLDLIKKSPCDYVIVSECNVVANYDYSKIVDEHIKSGADITVIAHTDEYGADETANATTYKTNGKGIITEIAINPAVSGVLTRGLNAFVITKSVLIDALKELVPTGKYNFTKDLIQGKFGELNMHLYEYSDYHAVITDLDSYYKANKALLDPETIAKLFVPKKPIYTKVRDDAPSKYGLDSSVNNSLVADGCIIDGIVENSIIFRGVKIEKGAVVKNSILMQDTVVGKDATVLNIIADKQVTVSDGVTVASAENCPIYVAKNRKL